MTRATTMQILTKRTFGGAAVLLAAFVGACALFGPPKPPVYEPFETPSGVFVQDLTVPDERAEIVEGQLVTVHAIVTAVWTEDGAEEGSEDGAEQRREVDNTEDRGQPLEFVFGEPVPGLPPAFAEGLVGLRDRGRRVLRLAPELAFGEEGVPGVVPPNATLEVVVEVLGVKDPEPGA